MNTNTLITLRTPQDCISQILEGYATVKRGYGLADEAIVAYLHMDGCDIQTLFDDLQAAGCEITKKTLQNRQSMLRGQGKLPPAEARYRRDGNGAIPESGMAKLPSGRPMPPSQSEDLEDPFDQFDLPTRLKMERFLDFVMRCQKVQSQLATVLKLLDSVRAAGGDCNQPGTMDVQEWQAIYDFVNPWAAEVDWCEDFETNVLPTLD